MTAKFFEKYEYELLIFTFLTVKFLFMPLYLGMILPFIIAGVLIVSISLLLGKVIRSAEPTSKRTVLFFVAFFLGSAVSNAALFLNSFIESNLFYLNIFFVFCLIISFNSAPKQGQGWHIPVVCFTCTVIEPLFVFIYLPTIAVVLLYEFNATRSKESKWVLAASTAAAAAALILARKSLVINNRLTVAGFNRSYTKSLLYSLAIVLPLILIFTFIWICTIKNSKDKNFKAIIILLMFLPVFPFLTLLFKYRFVNVILVAMFTQFCLLAYLLYKKDKAFLAAFGKTVQFFDKNQFVMILILVYLAAFSFLKYNLLIVNRLVT